MNTQDHHQNAKAHRACRWILAWGLLTVSATALAEPSVSVTNPESVVIRFVPVDNTPGGPALDGFVTTDIRFDLGPGDEYSGSQLLIHLDEGGFYRDPLGSPAGLRPRPEDLALSDSLAFDTYVTTAVGGGAFNLGGSVFATFPANGAQFLNQSWYPAAAEVWGVTDFTDARLTLSDQSTGRFEYLLFAGPGGVSYRQGVIVDGQLVPEPSAILCAGTFFLLFMHTFRRLGHGIAGQRATMPAHVDDDKARSPAFIAGVILLGLGVGSPTFAEPSVPVTNPESVVIRFVPVDNTPGGPALDGFVTTDIRFDLGPGDEYVWSQLLIRLDEGGFNRDDLGNTSGRRPRPEDLTLSDSLAFDTYIAQAGLGGGAADLGASVLAVFPADGGQLLSQAWSPGTAEVWGVTDFTDARLTLSVDSTGTFEYLHFAGPGFSYRRGVIVNGRFIPEPSACVFVGGVTLCGRFRFAPLI